MRNLDKSWRLILASSIPFMACGLQWVLWSAFKPFVWFLFYPTVFISSWLGGLAGGLIATVASMTLVIYFFIPPQLSFSVENPSNLYSVAVFTGMGVLFSLTHERLKKAHRQIAEALGVARQANDQLQAANEKITRLYDQTRELDELKSQFFANVSHELRTPLTLILGPVAKRLAAGDLSDDARRDLEVIDRNARLLYRHVSDLLDVAKLDDGKVVMHYAPVDLAQLARFVASHFEVLAAEKPIQFTVNTPAVLPAQVDREKCQRIMLNLLSNAFKFTPAGGAITLTLRATEDQACLQVADNGPGVPPEMHDAIFERFRQVDGSADRHYGGTGLGLAIAKEFVELHHGAIEVAEAPGGGALFNVTLPRQAPAGSFIQPTSRELDQELNRQIVDELRPVSLPSVPAAAGADAPLILIVEDNPDMNAFIAEVLGQRYRVVTAFDGEAGLARAVETHPALILSDIMMPKLSGDQLVAALRRQPALQGVPIVMLTAKADDALHVKLLQQGVQDYISKPFSAEELLARVDGLIHRHQQSESMRLRLAAIVESSDDAIIGKTLDGIVTSWNRGAEKLFGYTEADMLGKSILALFPPERVSEEPEILARVVRGESLKHFETVRLCKDGQRVDVSVTASPIRDEAGLLIGISKIARDITERKRATEALHQLNAELEQRVAERTRELSIANEKLRELDRLKDQFVSNVSHELRAPLTSILLEVELLEHGKREKHDTYLGVLRREANRLSKMIEDLLDLSRLDRDAVPVQLAPLDLNQLLAQLIADRVALASRHGLALDIESATHLPFALADATLLTQVIINLITNALNYTPAGGSVMVTTARQAAAQQDWLTFTVRDTGPGISAQDLPHLFERFYRGAVGRRASAPGTGLGLAISKDIVERLGGRITVESPVAPEKSGTAFTVWLRPAAD